MVKHESRNLSLNNVITKAVYERNIDAWRNPNRGNGSPALLSTRRNLQGMVENGGTLWIVVSRKRPGEHCTYSLTYKLTECKPFEAKGPSADAFGEFGVRGNPATSSFYPSNDAKLLLMSLRFANKKPIPSINGIGRSMQFPRYLTQEDLLLLEEYAGTYIDRRSVFISYAHEESAYATELKDALEYQGISVFRDEESILSGDYWREGIYRAIDHAKYFVILCSPSSAYSEEVKKEINLAHKRNSDTTKDDIIIIPVFLEGASVEDKAWSDLTAKFQSRFWDLSSPKALFDQLGSDIKHVRR